MFALLQTATQPIEDIINKGVQASLGDSMIIGLFFVVIFGAWVFLSNYRLEVKMLVMVPVLLIASMYNSLFGFMILLVGGVILGYGLVKFVFFR